MAINFPDSPQAGDPHTEAGVTWTYDGEKWVSNNTAAPAALWTRAGTVLSPATAGDDVDLGTGDLSAAQGIFSDRVLIDVPDTSTATALLQVQGRQGDATDYAPIILSRGSTPSTNSVPLGAISFTDVDQNRVGASITATSGNGSWTPGSNHRSRIVFSTTPDAATAPVDVVEINQDGNLLIGGDRSSVVNSPNITLDANGEVRINRAASGSVGIPISILNGLVGVLQVRPDGTTNIGGSLPNSPNITLSADGSAAYRRAEGNVYINSSSSNLLQVATPADAERVSLTVGGDVRHFGSVVPISDQSLKENIVDASPQWDDVKNIKLRNYTWIDAPEMGQMLGVIAQELEKVSPGLISEDEKGVKGFKLNPLVMKMLGALQEAQARIEALEAEVQSLKGGN